MNIVASVIIPVYNESKYIEKCIDSLLEQTYSKEKMEMIFVDGGSKDKTIELINKYIDKYPKLIRLLHNEKKIVPYAMNIGIANSKGRYIVRLDAHAEYSKDYIEKCIECLEETGADNVGGFAETKAKNKVGKVIAKVLSSRFGVGNSKFRTNGQEGYVDTVPFGAFKREIFHRLGGYDERLVRNQDNEMNYRIRKNGGKIYLSKSIRFNYYCRDSVKSISDMAYKNGKWNVITYYLCPGSMGIRHFVPMAFVLSLILLFALGFVMNLFHIILVCELCLYFLLDIIFSIIDSSSLYEFLMMFILFPVFHISYGSGSIAGLIKLTDRNIRKKEYSAPIL